MLLGITLLLSLATVVATLIHTLATTDNNETLLFWSLLFGLPFLIAGVALTIIGKFMLRKDRNTRTHTNKISHD